MKRLISLALSILLWVSLAAPCAAARAGSVRQCAWAAIEAIERNAAADVDVQALSARTAAYENAVDEMIRAVCAAPDYVPDSLDRHGDFFFWETTDGRANGYSPSLRARFCLAASNRVDDLSGTCVKLPEQTAACSIAQDAVAVPTSDPDLITAENRDVAVVLPYSESWYFYPELCIADGAAAAKSTSGNLKVYLQQDVTVDTLAEAIAENGFVLINSHGVTDYELSSDYASHANSSYICIPTDEGFTAADQQRVSGPYGYYRHAFYAGNVSGEEHYCVDGTCISNHMQSDAPNSFVWLGFCLGMVTEGLFAPLQQRNVEAMIGFSEAVTTDADREYRAAFCQALTEGATAGEAAAYMKEQVGCPDPYQTSHDPAWPVGVSSQDPYPGRDHVNEPQELLSGWELYPSYPIEITVEPAEGGRAVQRRTSVLITPAQGYTFSGWEITEGDCSAELTEADVLNFTLAGPCAVTIRFDARTPAELRFSAGSGQSAETITGYVDDVVTLPQPSGELTADRYLYHFVGWSSEPVAECGQLECPLLPAGSRYVLSSSEAELHAVYGYFVPENPADQGQFRLVTQEPSDWTGDYVLTYKTTKALRAERQYAGQAVSSPQGVISIEAAGYFADGEYLNEVPDSIVYACAPRTSGTWSLRMKGSENYLAVPSAAVLLTTVTDPAATGAGWRLGWNDGAPVIKNTSVANRCLQYSTSSSSFCALQTQLHPLTLYVRVPGEHLYTTSPQTGPKLPCDGGDDCPGKVFQDMPDKDHWAHDAIDWAIVNRVTAGTGDTTFSPMDTCTRAQIVTFLWRAAGSPEPETAENPFEDVPSRAYYEKAVLWAFEAGVTSGTGETTFSPDDGCTRAQVVTFLWRFARSPEPTVSTNPFEDVPIGEYYAKAVLWAAETGVTAGTGDTTFSPKDTCTRAQIVTFLYRFLSG